MFAKNIYQNCYIAFCCAQCEFSAGFAVSNLTFSASASVITIIKVVELYVMKLVFASFEFEFGRDARGKSLFQIVRAKMANSI